MSDAAGEAESRESSGSRWIGAGSGAAGSYFVATRKLGVWATDAEYSHPFVINRMGKNRDGRSFHFSTWIYIISDGNAYE